MKLFNKVLTWALLAMVGALILGFAIGGRTGGTVAAIWMAAVFVAGLIYTVIYQNQKH